jgi:putative hydrolase of the HAD superfamily
MQEKNITTLFLDIGGVLLSNGWGHEARNRAISYFNLDGNEMDERHHLTFNIYEEGKMTLEEYLNRIIFYEPREFSKEDFMAFMFSQSVPYPETIDFFLGLRNKYKLKIFTVSNEGRELNIYRIHKFKLNELFDGYISSSFVHFRKPDADIFRMAIDISQTPPENSLYIDDRLLFVEVAKDFGMNGIHYSELSDAKKQLSQFGFTIE